MMLQLNSRVSIKEKKKKQDCLIRKFKRSEILFQFYHYFFFFLIER